MKIKNFMFIAFILFQWMGSIHKVQADQNDLTQAEDGQWFEDLGDVCWETWCTEEFEIMFHDTFCFFKKKYCSFTLDFYEYKTEDGVIEDSFESNCSIRVNSIEELLAPPDFIMPDHILQQVEKCVYRAYPKALRYYKTKYGT